MKSKTETDMSPTLKYLKAAWEAIPGGSWQRLNHGMYAALKNAVVAGMRFAEEDVVYLYERLRASRWIGCSGEWIYALACGSERGTVNISAAIAFEKAFERPAYLWAEETKTATRLYVGAEFTWEGRRVVVTSFQNGYLVACDKQSNGRDEGIEYAFGGYRKVEYLKTKPEDVVMVRYGPKRREGTEKTKRRQFKIERGLLDEVRKAYDHRRKRYEKEMEAVGTLAGLEEIEARVVSDGRAAFRHFDIELLREAYASAKKRILESLSAEERERMAEQADLERWVNGECVRRHFQEVRLRIKGDWVETSTGQRATVEGVRGALGLILAYRDLAIRGGFAELSELSVDEFPVERVDVAGVKVGCTLVPWSEVDRILEVLKATQSQGTSAFQDAILERGEKI